MIPSGRAVRVVGRSGGRFYYYPGDGTLYRFSESTHSTYGRPWDQHKDGTGNILATTSLDGSALIQRVSSANTSIYLYFVYSSGRLDSVRINSTSSQTIVDYDVNASTGQLDSVAFASSIGTIDTDLGWTFTYDGTMHNLTTIEENLGGSAVTTGNFDYDGSDRVTTLEDRSKDLAIAYDSATQTTVTYDASAGSSETAFTHNGLWVTAANSDIRMGGIGGATVIRDEHGRTTCIETDDSRVYKLTYDADGDSTAGDGTVPTKLDEYGKTGSCTSGLGTVAHETWLAADYTTEWSWRSKWSRTKSVYSPASSCSGTSLPSNCRETKYDYVSSSDDRIQWITRTGYTKNVSDTVSQQIRKQRFFYFGLDTGTCTSGDSYSGLPCRVETQDSGGTVFARTDYTYVSSGATAGLLKATKRYKSSGTSLNTTYASHNAFGSPTSVTDERGMVTDYAFNGWNAVTSITENDAMKNDSGTLLDPATSYSYTDMRTVDTVTLPKGNKIVYKYFTGAGGFGRLKAYALADASANLTEIQRYENDAFGRQTETKILDSINGTTPCADEDCTTLDSRMKAEFDGLGRLATEYLYTGDTSDPADASQTYTYTSGKLSSVLDYLHNETDYDYDDQGRLSSLSRAAGGTEAKTNYAYDGQGQLLTTTSPTDVDTRTEHNDFGEVVLERSKTRGDIREEFDVTGRITKRRESAYNSSSSAQSHCYSYDWLGRKTAYDDQCNSTNDALFYYDGDSTPSSACETNTYQAGRLSMYTDAVHYKRVLCYHKNGRIHSVYQVMETATWSNSAARGFSRIYDLNGNLQYEYLEDRPDNTDHARKIEYVYDSTLKDRVQYVRHKLVSAGSWTLVTSDSTNPTYFAFGGFKTLNYANGIVETNEYDHARRLTRRKTDTTSPAVTYTDINLSYDVGGNITHYDDHLGKRHLDYYTAYDDLDRLRCVGRSSIGSCSGTEPWSSEDFLESFDYDKSGNRTYRRYGAYSSEDDEYTYATGTDIIDSVNGVEMSNSAEGEITEANTPTNLAYTWSTDGELTVANNDFLGDVHSRYTHFHDRYEKIAVCNERPTFYFYDPAGGGGTSHQLRVQDTFKSCSSEFPRYLRSYIYLEGRPIAAAYSTRSSGTDDQTEGETYWIHTDQLGTPILVTDDSGVELWRWENDPFGRNAPMDFTVSAQDVSPDDDPSTGGDKEDYNTCCCWPSCWTGCNTCETSCSAGSCTGGASQDVIWSKTYTVSGANNIRLHFDQFDVAAGTTRTGKDYVNLERADKSVIVQLTGDLSGHWSDWAGEGESSITVEFVADNVQDSTRGIVVDKLEYTTDTSGRFVLDLRMPGQVWDADAYASYNFRRWYRSEDGRYLSPDPIGLEAGEIGYFAYAGADPVGSADPDGLQTCEAAARSLCVYPLSPVREACCWVWAPYCLCPTQKPGCKITDNVNLCDAADPFAPYLPPDSLPPSYPRGPVRGFPVFHIPLGLGCPGQYVACLSCCSVRHPSKQGLQSEANRQCATVCSFFDAICENSSGGIVSPITKGLSASCWPSSGIN